MKERQSVCIRCGFEIGIGRYHESKSIPCPVCGAKAYRVKVIYRIAKRETYYCTNEECRVESIIVSVRK